MLHRLPVATAPLVAPNADALPQGASEVEELQQADPEGETGAAGRPF